MKPELYYFHCGECDFDSDEAKRLSTWKEGICPLCAGDTGRDVWLSYRPATPDGDFWGEQNDD
jgi:hypothetical protein